jgi:hypothetical protein
MAKSVSNNETLEVLRQSYNDLVNEVGGLGTLRTNQKSTLVDSINSIIDQYFYFQDFEYDGSDGASSNRTFSGNDNFGNSLNYSVNRLLVFKNGTLLRSGTDYSAANGTSITLASSAANSDVIRITSFTGSYEGIAGTTAAATTQWTKTGAGSIYNHDTTAGVVINSDATSVVTTPASGYGIQLESDGSNIYLNTGGTSKEVFVNGNLNLTSGATIKVNGSQITASDLSGFSASSRALFSAGNGIAYNSSTGQISATGSADTTGNAATATALQNARTIHGVSFNGTANIDLTEQIQDTVGALISGSGSTTATYNDSAGTLVISSTGKTTEEIQDIVGGMVSSNTETGIAVAYEDGDGTLDFTIADASTSAKGLASFNSGQFSVSSGAVQLATAQVIPSQSSHNGKFLTTNGSALSWGAISQTDTTYSTSFVDSSNDAILRLTAGGSGSGNDDLKFVAGSNITLTPSGDNLTIASTQKTQEEIEDIVGAMFTGTGATSVSYNDSTGTVTVNSTDTNTDTNTNQLTVWNIAANGTAGTDQVSHGDTVTFSGAGATTVTRSGDDITITSTDTNTNTTYSTATSSALGLVKIGYSENGKNYPVELSSGKMFVNVPWSDTNTDTNTVTSVGVSGQQNTGTITLAASGASSISQSGNTITINSTDTNTDTNTTYSAGVGLSLSGTSFSVSNIYARNMNQYTDSGSVVTFAEVRSTGNITAYYSDDRLKTRLGSIKNPVDKVCALNGFYFKQNEKGNEITPQYADQLQVGVSAQEIKSVLPEVVVENAIEGQYDSVHYDKVVPLLIEAIKELKSEIESLKS